MEFINGEIVVQFFVKRYYGFISGNIYLMIKIFVIKNGLGEVFFEKVMICFICNDYELDICYFDIV